VKNGYVATDANAEAGGIAYLLNRRVGRKLLVSTQDITLTPGNTLYQQYSSEQKKKEALESYGITTRILFADPTKPGADTGQDTEDPYFAVTSITLNGAPVSQGSGELSITGGNVMEITGTQLTEVGIKINILTNPLGDPATTSLSAIGTLTVSDTLIALTVTTGGTAYYLLRADNDAIIYSFS
jgi:hypothetical protein